MLVIILMACISAASCKTAEIECTTCVKLDSSCYHITHLLNFDAPFRQSVVISKMGIHRSENVLLYAFEPNITDQEYYKVGYVYLEKNNSTATNRSGILEGNKSVTNFKTFAIDQDKNIIYLGGGDAIYVLDDINKKALFYSSGGDTIQSMFFKTNLFFVRYGEFRIVEKQDELFKPYEMFRNVKNFVINRNNVFVYLNTSGLYASKLITNSTVQLSRNPFFRGLAIDLDDIVYAWWIDGIYRVTLANDLEDSKIAKIADIDKIGALTFDNDNNLLFSSSKGLFKLTQTNATIC